MNRQYLLYLFLITAVAADAASTVNLDGKVISKAGKPVSGAIVTIVGQKLSDTTNSSGDYKIASATGIKTGPAAITAENITFENGCIGLNLSEASDVTIDIFDMKGQLLKSVLRQRVPAGSYRHTVFSDLMASGMLAIRVSCGESVSIFRYVPLGSRMNGVMATGRRTGEHGSGMAQLMATVDSLRVTADGYETEVVALSSFQTTINVTLDTLSAAGLDKFSFFVTSMKALQDLSKSEKGFGGDFRFSKTGMGAGLLGADSICSCIAERSMEGASAKKWRAFLSVAEGPDGKQVNAIDRIGEGPWYDRLGRIVSKNKDELLQERPAGAHSAIKNDLPNEDGVPNHQPDPNQPVVDNHMIVTGSNTKGELYNSKTDSFGSFPGMGGGQTSENPTCNDWTSTTAKSRPRVGLSWPQSGSMRSGAKNWISIFDASGCEPGIDLDESTLAGKPGVYTIGNGGGYGGFYCFALVP